MLGTNGVTCASSAEHCQVTTICSRWHPCAWPKPLAGENLEKDYECSPHPPHPSSFSFVQYQVVRDNLYDAFYKLTDSRSQITSYVFDVVRATVPKMNLVSVCVCVCV